MPKINQVYNELYDNMNAGVYDVPVRRIDNDLKVSMEISVKKVKEACNEKGVDFRDFMEYARKRKAEENAKN